jgi:hypothetical protein
MVKTETYTLSKLVKITGAKPYIIKYLHSLGSLETANESRGQGYPIKWTAKAIPVIKEHIAKS